MLHYRGDLMLKTLCKILLFPLVLLTLAPSYLFADEVPALETPQDKESYSIGYQVGLSMKSDGVEVNFDKLIQGLQDAITEQEPLLSIEEMRSLIVARKDKARDEALRKYQEAIVKNAEESEKILAENAKKEGVKTTESGLQYKIIKEGEGEIPNVEDFVTVHYRGTLTDGTEFDSSYSKGEPQTFQTDGVIKGWTEALQMMKVGSQWEIFVPPDLAYGRTGMLPKIPPNSVLVFEIELLSIEPEKATEERQP
jgi:FKBP-type peptidyl-prolyl cis-trans isomerase FklB